MNRTVLNALIVLASMLLAVPAALACSPAMPTIDDSYPGDGGVAPLNSQIMLTAFSLYYTDTLTLTDSEGTALPFETEHLSRGIFSDLLIVAPDGDLEAGESYTLRWEGPDYYWYDDYAEDFQFEATFEASSERDETAPLDVVDIDWRHVFYDRPVYEPCSGDWMQHARVTIELDAAHSPGEASWLDIVFYDTEGDVVRRSAALSTGSAAEDLSVVAYGDFSEAEVACVGVTVVDGAGNRANQVFTCEPDYCDDIAIAEDDYYASVDWDDLPECNSASVAQVRSTLLIDGVDLNGTNPFPTPTPLPTPSPTEPESEGAGCSSTGASSGPATSLAIAILVLLLSVRRRSERA